MKKKYNKSSELQKTYRVKNGYLGADILRTMTQEEKLQTFDAAQGYLHGIRFDRPTTFLANRYFNSIVKSPESKQRMLFNQLTNSIVIGNKAPYKTETDDVTTLKGLFDKAGVTITMKK